MVRPGRTAGRSGFSFPHARGDGPLRRGAIHADLSFSPRPWGWSGRDEPRAGQDLVFPTPVGMVRCDVAPFTPISRFPHARGDGPAGTNRGPVVMVFSPRPW